jgi:hypothetical protein
MLCLISDQHRDVANLVTGIGVAVRFGDLVEPVSSTNRARPERRTNPPVTSAR